ncbi:MAG TPA: zinc ribbon domain-containing protein [Candidatus Binataceae bacterium]|nr:zinc ribbon domain-containing protein [Candidatus Binataceae bacterium]
MGRRAAELPIENRSTILSLRMPIFEYECGSCGATLSRVVLGSEKAEQPQCARCGSANLNRVMSAFAIHTSEASRLAAFDTRAPRDDTFYKDSRNVGLWAKKRAQEMGVSLGAKFDETVDAARSGSLIKDIPGND